MRKNSLIKHSLLICVGIIVGILVGWFYRASYTAHQPSTLVEVRENSPEYHYINPLLYIDNNRQAPELDSLKSTLNSYVSTAVDQKLADSVSIYFRDLNSGRWTGINEDDTYEPSSMLKVLVMMSYLKQAEANPAVLDKKLYYQTTTDPGQYFKPAKPLQTGYYSTDEIINSMITQSDNEAVDVLDKGNDSEFYNVYNTLKLPPVPEGQNVADYMSPKSYSALFRTLFNATYLSNDLSEKALSLLTKTTFTQGLVAGVPQGTIVAHKFGEHTVQDELAEVESRELHDCGIVYYPNSPYLLCVMTKGKDFPNLETIISTISKITYGEIPTLKLGTSK